MDPLKSQSPRWKRWARQLVPSRVQAHLRELRELSGRERRVHLATTLRRLASTPAPVPSSLDEHGTILFVCYGNIIRSALAAALMRRHALDLGLGVDRVRSAGLSAKAGREADPRAVAAGHTLGVDLREHRAQPLTREMVDEAAVIFVMDRLNEAKLLARFPHAAGRLRRLGALAVSDEGDIIADPYVLDAAAVADAAQRIDRATRELVRELARRRGHPSSGS
jgi:low molecular weight protein-tyrosine phosphatase